LIGPSESKKQLLESKVDEAPLKIYVKLLLSIHTYKLNFKIEKQIPI
jgi:hypothetical protein